MMFIMGVLVAMAVEADALAGGLVFEEDLLLPDVRDIMYEQIFASSSTLLCSS
jgi:hypothetical protein